jgi:hypothetical protein
MSIARRLSASSAHLPRPLALEAGGRSEIVLRAALPGDGDALRLLARLVDRQVPAAPVLLATSDGDVVAALSLATGEVVTDPFRPTIDLVGLLRLRATQLHELAAA